MNGPVNAARRKLVLGIMTLPVTSMASAAIQTPRTTEGPFYPTENMRFDDVDNDLVKVSSVVKESGGEVVRLEGRVLDRQGRPVEAARVEIWQCDANGRYLHRSDSGWRERDKAFQGFGFDLCKADGSFSFRTIKPVPYSGRTPHIHLKVLLASVDRLTTQLYLPDHPDNKHDWLYQHIPENKRELVTMVFNNNDQIPRATVELVI